MSKIATLHTLETSTPQQTLQQLKQLNNEIQELNEALQNTQPLKLSESVLDELATTMEPLIEALTITGKSVTQALQVSQKSAQELDQTVIRNKEFLTSQKESMAEVSKELRAVSYDLKKVLNQTKKSEMSHIKSKVLIAVGCLITGLAAGALAGFWIMQKQPPIVLDNKAVAAYIIQAMKR